MSTRLRPCVLGLALLAACSQNAEAGMVGFTVAPAVPAPYGSIDVTSNGAIVGTNINVTSVFGAAVTGSTPTTYSIGAYLDFSTGALVGTAADGVKTYSGTNANFFILGGVLDDPTHGAGSAPLAFSVDLLATVAPPSTTSSHYTLTATLISAYLDPTIAQGFGLVGGSNFNGSFSLSFDFDSARAGDQVTGGSIGLTPQAVQPNFGVPAPPSMILAALGLFGASFGGIRSRLRPRRAGLAA